MSMSVISRPAASDVEGVQRRLQGTRQRVEEWMRQYLTADRDNHSWLQQAAAFEAEATRTLTEAEVKAREEAHEMTRVAQRQMAEVDALVEDLTGLRMEDNELRMSLLHAQAMLDDVRKANAACREEVSEEEQVKQRRMDALKRAVRMYRDALGLRFDSVGDGGVRVTFTYVDPLLPLREFHFVLHTRPDKVFEVHDCQPLLPNIADLVMALNASNDVSAFFKAARRGFCLAVAGPVATTEPSPAVAPAAGET